MITRRYFYSGSRRCKEGFNIWHYGAMQVVSWFPLPAGTLLEMAEQNARNYIELRAPDKAWHDQKARIVAFNKI